MYLESDAKRKKCSPQNIPQVFSCNKASVFVVKLVEGCLIIINDTKSYFLQKNSQSQIKQPGTPIYVLLLKSYLCSFCCFWNHSSTHHRPLPRRPTEVQDRIFLQGQHISCALQVIWNIKQRYAVKYISPSYFGTHIDRIFLHSQHISCALQVISNAFLFWARSWCWRQRYVLFCFFALTLSDAGVRRLKFSQWQILCALARIPFYDNRDINFVQTPTI